MNINHSHLGNVGICALNRHISALSLDSFNLSPECIRVQLCRNRCKEPLSSKACLCTTVTKSLDTNIIQPLASYLVGFSILLDNLTRGLHAYLWPALFDVFRIHHILEFLHLHTIGDTEV